MEVEFLYEKFGPYQLIIFILGFIVCIYSPFQIFVHLFLSENNNFRCFIPECDVGNYIYKEPWFNITIPIAKDGSGKYESCLRFAPSHLTNSCIASSFNFNKTEKCSKWVFESDYETLARRWNLLCDKQWIWDTAESIYMAGVILGAVAVGILCDRYGRRKTFIIFTTCICAASVTKTFSPNFTFYLGINFFVGCFTQVSVPFYSLCLESVGPKLRSTLGMGYGIAYAIGELLIALFAYYYPDWRSISYFVSFSAFTLIIICFIMPESIVWLSKQNKSEALHAEISRAAYWNGLQVSPYNCISADDEDINHIENDVICESRKQDFGNPLLLFKTPYIRKCTIAQMLIWFCASLVYFGASLGSKDLGSNYLVTFVLLAAIEIPTTIFGAVALLKIGRKSIQIVLMTICGIVFVTNIFLPDDLSMVKTGLAVLGKGCVSAQWNINVVYTVELFPMVVRNVGFSTASLCSSIAVIIASYIPDLVHVHKSLPSIIFCVCGFLPAIALCFLPETAHLQKMFDTIEEAENKNKPVIGFANNLDCHTEEK